MIRVLVTDDSKTARMMIAGALERAPDIQIVGEAGDGREAIAMCRALQPDLVTMDVLMPELDGLRATQRIMQDTPTPIVIVSSSVDAAELDVTFEALRAGALDVLEKPKMGARDTLESFERKLVRTVRALAGVRVVRRRALPASSGPAIGPPSAPPSAAPSPSPSPSPPPASVRGSALLTSPPPSLRSGGIAPRPSGYPCSVIAMGASTGGPEVLAHVLAQLPADFDRPVLLVQHMTRGFIDGFVRWLQSACRVRVKLAQNGERMTPGTVHVAPDDVHLRLGTDFRLALTPDPDALFRPSVDELFHAVAASAGPTAVGVLLSGMGSDGANGLLAVRRAGGWTIAQTPDSCVVSGMPAVAEQLQAVAEMLPPDALAPRLVELAGSSVGERA